jgi:hypothetical protein
MDDLAAAAKTPAAGGILLDHVIDPDEWMVLVHDGAPAISVIGSVSMRRGR